jgi:uncharacterized membrane protein HdeD (DUF308 family)
VAAIAVAQEEVYEERVGRWWWVFLITGTAWLFLAMIMFRFNLTSVKSIGILAGIVFLAAGAFSFTMVAVVHSGWWKALNALLGVLLIVGAINAFARPGDAFVAIASVTGFMFMFVGILDLIVAFSDRTGLWWLRMISGFICIGFGFWASGEFAKSAYLLIVWLGVFSIFRGVNHIIIAFQLRHLHKELPA